MPSGQEAVLPDAGGRSTCAVNEQRGNQGS
ncbi:MAG: hypothetical protein JWM26_115, partial [Betaproteobacteria bacterium]|nr:hypothetical protein [Betaproteobacteria bacterium]